MLIVLNTIRSIRRTSGHNLRKEDLWKNVRFHKFQDALDRVDECASDLECNVSITFEDDATFSFFGKGRTIATWICDDEEDERPFHGISHSPVSKKGYLRKEKAWETVFWRV